MGHRLMFHDCRTTAVALPQRRCTAAVPPKGVRLPPGTMHTEADRRTTDAGPIAAMEVR
jgi:hypothetical protein